MSKEWQNFDMASRHVDLIDIRKALSCHKFCDSWDQDLLIF